MAPIVHSPASMCIIQMVIMYRGLLLGFNNGFFLQYGVYSRSGYSASNKTHTFPVAFTIIPKVFITVLYTGDYSAGFGGLKVDTTTKTTYTKIFDMSHYWLAVGK